MNKKRMIAILAVIITLAAGIIGYITVQRSANHGKEENQKFISMKTVEQSNIKGSIALPSDPPTDVPANFSVGTPTVTPTDSATPLTMANTADATTEPTPGRLVKLSSLTIKNNEVIDNKYFFSNVYKQYKFQGSEWNDVWHGQPWYEKFSGTDNDPAISGSLDIKKVADLEEGQIFQLTFNVTEPEYFKVPNYKSPFPERVLLWVLKDKIYEVNCDNNDCILLQPENDLPLVTDKDIRCQEVSIPETPDSDNRVWKSKIEVDGNSCKYDNSNNNGHFRTFDWEKGKGLVKYAMGYGAHREGFTLKLVE